jgi:hypothetical protein
MNILELFTVFDWVSPALNTAKDIHHAITDGEPTMTIWLDKYSLNFARQELRRCGLDVISDTMVAGDPVAGLDVRDSQYNEAVTILIGCGIQVYQ